MKSNLHKLGLGISLASLLACTDNRTTGAVDDIGNIAIGSSYVQKGPFVQGSEISIQELDTLFTPLGRTYTTETNDDFGSFTLDSKLQSPIIEMSADGYYFNEVTGEIDGRIVLKMVANIQDSSSVTINILTTIAKERIKYLVTHENLQFSSAKAQAEYEVIQMFGFPIQDLGLAYTGFETWNIADSGNANAMLLAASVILQGHQTAGELSEFISKISNDLKLDGVLTDTTLAAKIKEHKFTVDTAAVRVNLQKRYQEIGVTATIPAFEDYLDSDGDGHLNKFDHNIYVGNAQLDSVNFVTQGEKRPTFRWGSVAGTSKYRLILTEKNTNPMDTNAAIFVSNWIADTTLRIGTSLELNQMYQAVVQIDSTYRAPVTYFAIISGSLDDGFQVDNFSDSTHSTLWYLQSIYTDSGYANWGIFSKFLDVSFSKKDKLNLTINNYDSPSPDSLYKYNLYTYLPFQSIALDPIAYILGNNSGSVDLSKLDSISFDYSATSGYFSLIIYHKKDVPYPVSNEQQFDGVYYALPKQSTFGHFSVSTADLLKNAYISSNMENPLKNVIGIGFTYRKWDEPLTEAMPIQLQVDNLSLYGEGVKQTLINPNSL